MIADMVARSDGFGTADFPRSVPTKNNVSPPQMLRLRAINLPLLDVIGARHHPRALDGQAIACLKAAQTTAWKRWKIKGIGATDDRGEG